MADLIWKNGQLVADDGSAQPTAASATGTKIKINTSPALPSAVPELVYSNGKWSQTGPLKDNPGINSNVSLPTKDTGQDLQSSNWQDTFRESLAPILRTIGVDAGRAGGSALGALIGAGTPAEAVSIPAGNALGGVGADQLYQLMQRFSPRTFGAPPNSVGDSLLESGEQTAYSAAGQGLGKLAGSVAKKLIPENLFSGSAPRTQVFRDALKTGPDLDPSVGQSTGNRVANVIEDVFSPAKKANLVQKQQGILKQEAQDLLDKTSGGTVKSFDVADVSPAQIAKQGEAKAQAMFDSAKQSERAKWDNATAKINQEQELATTFDKSNGQQKTFPMQGPVFIHKLQGVSQQLDTDLESTINSTADPRTKAILTDLQNNIKPYLEPPVTARSLEPVLPYDGLKATRDLLWATIKDKDLPPQVSMKVGLLRKVAATIDEDIASTAGNNWQPGTAQALNQAKAKTRGIADAFYDDKELGNLNPDLAHKKALSTALDSPDAARAYRVQTGNRTELGTTFFRDITRNATDATGYFDGSKAFKELTDRGDVAKQVATSDLRSKWSDLFKKMAAVTPPSGNAPGTTSFMIKNGAAVLSIGSGVAGGLMGGAAAGIGAGGSMLAATALSHKVVEKLFYNSRSVYLLGQLVKATPGSAAAASISKTLLKGYLNGQIFETQYGKMRADDGQLVPIDTTSQDVK